MAGRLKLVYVVAKVVDHHLEFPPLMIFKYGMVAQKAILILVMDSRILQIRVGLLILPVKVLLT